MGGDASTDFDTLRRAMKRAAAALRDGGVPFVLGGGFATWARGAPGTDHDVDFMVKPADAEKALEVLAAAGMRTEKPPEGWLYKAYDGDALVDIIFRPVNVDIDDDVFARADELDVDAVPMLVMSIEDVLVFKMLALNERSIDYGGLLEAVRAVREQVDWADVRARTKESPFARAFFYLAEELAILPREG